ncbi:hypothetical protein [Priestia taiwanensis]|uniref:Uncharacterized protein n=1 Tax=Priestia taiwanensis TaxID=1347902 RepID=A0A917EKS8_9BACI|nr:hypothetical protein [Priestia taiwanensis]MBM7361925.1 Trk-type K+ transport system membrane component [Priestia taiwanensis]GGE58053.1 hypothetical protein GCM10007140_05510 [Priestia taiwanensis]
MLYDFILTFIIAFFFIGAINFVIHTYFPKDKLERKKRLVIYTVQSAIAALLLVFVI